MLPKVYLTARLVPNHTQPRVVPSKERAAYSAAEAAIAKRLPDTSETLPRHLLDTCSRRR